MGFFITWQPRVRPMAGPGFKQGRKLKIWKTHYLMFLVDRRWSKDARKKASLENIFFSKLSTCFRLKNLFSSHFSGGFLIECGQTGRFLQVSPRPREPFRRLRERWQRKKKHIFVFSNAGKPIFSRYGDESDISDFFGVMQVWCIARGSQGGIGPGDKWGVGQSPQSVHHHRTPPCPGHTVLCVVCCVWMGLWSEVGCGVGGI